MHFVLEKGNFLSAAESHLVTSIPLYRVSLGYRAPSSWKEEEGGGALHHHEVVSIVIGFLADFLHVFVSLLVPVFR